MREIEETHEHAKEVAESDERIEYIIASSRGVFPRARSVIGQETRDENKPNGKTKTQKRNKEIKPKDCSPPGHRARHRRHLDAIHRGLRAGVALHVVVLGVAVGDGPRF